MTTPNSTVRVINFDKTKLTESWLSEFKDDPNFEIAYVAKETFASGFECLNVIYWHSDPTPQPPAPRNQPVKKKQPIVSRISVTMDLDSLLYR